MGQTSAERRSKEWRLPNFDITEDHDGYYVYLDMPGVSQERLDVEYHNKELTVTGSVDNGKFDKLKLGWQEYRPIGFKRRFTVPEQVNASAIQAHIRDGVVKLSLPKSEEVKPRRIEINAG